MGGRSSSVFVWLKVMQHKTSLRSSLRALRWSTLRALRCSGAAVPICGLQSPVREQCRWPEGCYKEALASGRGTMTNLRSWEAFGCWAGEQGVHQPASGDEFRCEAGTGSAVWEKSPLVSSIQHTLCLWPCPAVLFSTCNDVRSICPPVLDSPMLFNL